MGKKRIQNLIVVFDTNVLFTQAAAELVRNDVQRIVSENSSHPDLKISWYLPEVVIGERRYQMLGKAKELLPNMQKLENLLGHSFGVGEDTLELHVNRAIDIGIAKYAFQTASVRISEVDWGNIIHRSVTRQAPFEANEREKGFRDSIIAQSFLQLHKSSPATPTICLLALVSEDQRLREYVSELTAGTKNVRVLTSLDELESLINTLVSTIPEDLSAQLAEKAGKMFFEKENDKTFYCKERIRDKINERFANEFNATIIPGHQRSNGTWWISKPIFIRKERQRIHWVSTIAVDFEIFHNEPEVTAQDSLAALASLVGGLASTKGTDTQSSSTPFAQVGKRLGLANALRQKKIIDMNGKDKFEVHWSASLSQAHNLTSPKLETIKYAGNGLSEDRS